MRYKKNVMDELLIYKLINENFNFLLHYFVQNRIHVISGVKVNEFLPHTRRRQVEQVSFVWFPGIFFRLMVHQCNYFFRKVFSHIHEIFFLFFSGAL